MAEAVKRGLWNILSPLLSAALVLIGYSFLTGRSAGALETEVVALKERVEKVERESESIRGDLKALVSGQSETNQRLARIEGKLDRR